MGCCSSSSKLCCSRSKSDTIRLMTFGLDGAGKTSFIKYVLKDPSSDIVPTIGFSSVDLKSYRKFNVQVYDTGGGKNIRDIWINYFPFVHGLVLVIDSSDTNRIDQVKEILESVLSNLRVQGKPLLVLINKQDVEGSLDETALVQVINLNSIVNKYKIPTRVESCSLINRWANRFTDNPLLDRGYQWLLGYIQANWEGLSSRVEIETSEQIKLEQEVMRKRIEKFRNQENQDNQMNHQEREDCENVNCHSNDSIILEEITKETLISGKSDLKDKLITQRRLIVNEPKERTIFISGSLDKLDQIVEGEGVDASTIHSNPQNKKAKQLNNRRPKSSTYGERRNSNFKWTINRNKIAPL